MDRWLWHARFFKTRSLAAKLVSDGAVRVNGIKVAKPATAIAAGDVLTFPQARVVRVVRIAAIGTRRGPASEAAALYADLTPTPEPGSEAQAPRVGKRPTKKDRRDMDALRDPNPEPDP